MFRRRMLIIPLLISLVLSVVPGLAQDLPPADIVNDEGGPVAVTGSVTYTYPFFTDGVAAPVIILEDQAGFIDRNRYYLMPEKSQTLGQITSDFYTSPFTYSLALPIEPQGTLRDVDNDGEEDTGVMVFAIAYWENVFGDPFLEERDLQGGGWSTAYASTRVSEEPSTEYEIVGGKFLVYAPDDTQGFPSGFGEDELLFTEDDPIVRLPAGYTIVNMDTDPFTFDRSRNPEIDLIEPESIALVDFSDMGYVEAFEAMLDKFRDEYAFTEYKDIDWDALYDEFLPRFEEAEANGDLLAYALALRDFTWSIPDGHVSGPFISELYRQETDGSLGLAVRELDDERVVVNFITPGGPAEEADIEMRAELLEIDGAPISDVIDATVPWSSPFSTEHTKRLQQVRYAVRFPVGTEVEVTYQNPESDEPETTTLTTVSERESWTFSYNSAFGIELTDGFELPVEYKLLDSGYVYASIYSFLDNNLLTVLLWERMITTMKENQVPGLIIDMRQNGGGWSWLASDLAAYFFNEQLVIGYTAVYDEDVGEFYIDPRSEEIFYLPAEDFRYNGEVAVLVGPQCASACESFSYAMTIDNRAAIVGHYPTMGLGGGVEDFLMPEGIPIRFTASRGLGPDKEINIEGIGVVPNVRVPVTEETIFAEGDPVLEAAVEYLDRVIEGATAEAGPIEVGEAVEGELLPGMRVTYTLDVAAEDALTITLTDPTGELDTVLRLYDENGSLLVENDDIESGVQANSAIEAWEPPGDMTVTVEVATYDDALSGAYTLEVVSAE